MPLFDSLLKISAGIAEAGILANRAARILRTTPLDARHLPGAVDEFIGAAKQSFKFLDLANRRALILPLEVPLSVGTLITQSGLRGLASLSVVGLDRFPTFLATVFEMFAGDKETADKYENHLKDAPTGHATPAISGSRIFVRNRASLYAFAARPGK